jgi:hypothetical protein
MKIPDQRLILMFKEMPYISFPVVVNPKMVRIIPNIENMAPIGIFISSPIIFKI